MCWIACASLALLAIVAGMYLLAKTKKEELGKLFKWVSYIVVICGFLCLACLLGQGIVHLSCRTGICGPERCHGMGMMPGGPHCGMGMEGGMCAPMGGGCMKGMQGCCKGHEGMGRGCRGEMGKCGMEKKGCGGMNEEEEKEMEEGKADSSAHKMK